MKQCWVCGNDVQDDAVKCPECGTELIVNKSKKEGDDSPAVLNEDTTGYVPPMDSSIESNTQSSGLRLKTDVEGNSFENSDSKINDSDKDEQPTYYNNINNSYGSNDMYDMTADTYTQKEKNGSKIVSLIVFIAAVAIIASAIWFFFFRATNTPEEAINGFMQAIDDGDFDKLYDYVPDFESSDSEVAILIDYLNESNSMGVEFEIKNLEITNKERLSGAYLNAIEDDIKEDFDETVNIRNGYSFDVSFTMNITYMGYLQVQDNNEKIYVIQIGNKYYVY